MFRQGPDFHFEAVIRAVIRDKRGQDNESQLYVCLREYWAVVDKKKKRIPFYLALPWISWIVPRLCFRGKTILGSDQFMIQGHFQIHFHPLVDHAFQEKNKNKKTTKPSVRMLSYRMAEPAQQFSL